MLQELRDDVKLKMARGDDLTELPGIGPDLAGKISEIALPGKSTLPESLRRAMPPAVMPVSTAIPPGPMPMSSSG